MKKALVALAITGVFMALIFLSALGNVTVEAKKDDSGPKTGEIWICPSTSLHNSKGMWVIGAHGAYYILKPGTASPNWPMILNPTGGLEKHAAHVEDKAQIPAGWALYKDFPTYPYYAGTAMVLDDGADEFGLDEGMQTITEDMMIPLASAVFW